MQDDKVAHYGFTGTQQGMTREQFEALLLEIPRGGWWHHGDCIGADKQSHDAARARGLLIAIHPPRNPRKRAWCDGDAVLAPKEYIVRNHDIVDLTEQLFAAPSSQQEELRSGTWATIRYARKRRRPITLIFPNGSVRRDDQSGSARVDVTNEILSAESPKSPPDQQELLRRVAYAKGSIQEALGLASNQEEAGIRHGYSICEALTRALKILDTGEI